MKKYIVFGSDGNPWRGGPFSSPVPGHISVTHEQAMRAPQVEEALVEAESALAFAAAGFDGDEMPRIQRTHDKIRPLVSLIREEAKYGK